MSAPPPDSDYWVTTGEPAADTLPPDDPSWLEPTTAPPASTIPKDVGLPSFLEQPVPEGAPDWFKERFEENEKAADARVKALLDAATSTDGDRHARILQINREQGIPIDIIEKGYDELVGTVDAANRDDRQWRYDNPSLYKWMLEDTKRAPLVEAERGALRKALDLIGDAYSFIDEIEDTEDDERSLVEQGVDLYAASLGPFTKVPRLIGEAAERVVEGRPISGETQKRRAERPATETREANPARGFEMIADVAKRATLGEEKSKLWAQQQVLERRLRHATAGVAASDIDTDAMESMRQEAWQNRVRIARIDDELGQHAQDYGAGGLNRFAQDVTEVNVSQWGFLKSMGAGGLAGAAIGGAGAVAAARYIPILPKSTIKEGARLGASWGARLFGAHHSFTIEKGSLYEQLTQARDDDGNPIDPDVADMVALLGGAMKAGVEVLSFGPQARALGGEFGESLLKGKVSKSLVSDISKGSTARLLKQMARDWRRATLAEGGEESAQTFIDFLGEWSAKSISSGEANEFDPENRVVADVLEAGYKGSLGAASMSTVGAPARITAHAVRVEAAKANGAKAAAIAGLAQSDIARSAPADVARLIEIDTERLGEPVTSLYVDVFRFVEEVGKDGDPMAAAKELMGEEGPARLKSALAQAVDATGQRATLEVGVEEYLENWGGKPVSETLRQDLTTKPGPTVRETAAAGATRAGVMQLAKELSAESVEDDQTAGPHERQLAADQERQLIKAGFTPEDARFSASVWRAYLRTTARLVGEDVEDHFRNWSVSVERNTGGAPVATRVLAQTVKNMDPTTHEGQLARSRAMWNDPNTGTLNARAFAALPVDESRRHVAHLSFAGTKWKNTEGHDQGNDLYRAAGQALAKIVPDAAKWGGDFVAYVRDEAHAAELAQEWHTALRDELRRMNPNLADEIGGLGITFGTVERGEDLGATVDAAKDINNAKKAALEESGERRKRGEQPLGIPVADPSELQLSADPAAPIDVPSSLSDAVAEMSDEQLLESVYIDQDSGMLTREGWLAIPRKEFVASLDLNGLGYINDHPAYGRDVGNGFLSAFYDVAKLAGAADFDMAHLSGDEFALQSDNKELLQWFIDTVSELGRLDDATNGIVLEIEATETKPARTIHGLTFGYGIDKDYASADARVEANKRAGIANERRDREIRAEGWRRSGGPSGRAPLARGDLPQGDAGLAQQPGKSERVFGAIRGDARANIEKARLAILRNADPAEVARDLRELKSGVLTEAAVDATIASLGTRPIRRERSEDLRTMRRTFDAVLDASFPEGSHPTEVADSKYRAFLDGRGKDPGPFGGTTFEGVDQLLGLTGERRVRGALHAFNQLMRSADGSQAEKAERAVEVLQGVQGYESVRLPDDINEQLALDRLEAEEGQRAIEFVDDASFDVDEIEATDPNNFYPPDGGADVLTQDDVDPLDSRGYVTMTRDGVKRTARIMLNEEADLSTFLHESAHVFFEMMGDMAEHPAANDRVKRDHKDLLGWLGAKDRASVTTEQKETYARAFEAYLREGKAPSLDLAGPFEAFRQWLTKIYATLKPLRVELNDDIRGIFDRMLATDGEIANRKAAMGFAGPIYRSPAEAGVDPKDWRAYLEALGTYTSKAAARAHAAQAKEQLRALKAIGRSERKKLAQEALDAWNSRADVKAWRFLRLGETRSDDGQVLKNSEWGKLDRELVTDVMGEGSEIETKLRGRLKRGGMYPDTVAEWFGFPTGKAMLEAVLALPDAKTEQRQWIEDTIRERHPELETDAKRLQEVVDHSLHQSTDWLLKELALLRSRDNALALVTLESVSDAATEVVGSAPIGRLRPGAILNRERAAAEKAAVAIANGNYREAHRQKLKQLLEMMLWRETSKAVDERTKFERDAKKMGAKKYRAKLGLADPSYRDVTDNLLEAIGLATDSTKDADRDERADVGTMLNVMEENGELVVFDPGLLMRVISAKHPPNWRDLTVAEMRDIRDAMANIRKAANHTLSVTVDGAKYDKETVVDALISEAEENMPDLGSKIPEETFDPLEFVSDAAHGVDAMLLRATTVLQWLGGEKLDSMWNRAIVKKLRRAAEAEHDMLEEVIKPLWDAMEAIPNSTQKRWDEKVDGSALFPNHTDAIAAPRKRFELLILALNRGNASNLQRTADGRNMTVEEIDNAIATLSREELAWVRSVWDASQSLWPAARDLEERYTGVRPQAVKPTPFVVQTADGPVEMPGGYFPLIYDADVTSAGKRQAADVVKSMVPGSMRPTTRRSHLQKRDEKDLKELVVSLTPRGIMAGLFQSAHDIAYREALREVAGLVLDPRVKSVLVRRAGVNNTRQIENWLRDIAGYEAARNSPHAPKVERFSRYVRTNFSRAVLGGALDNVAADPTSMLVVPIVTEARARYLAEGAVKAFNPLTYRATRKEALRKSGALRLRDAERVHEVAREVRRLGRSKALPARVQQFVKDHAFDVFRIVDNITSTAIWHGAHRQATAEGKSDAAAVDFADNIVAQSMPAVSVVETAPIQRDRGLAGTMTLFYGYFSLVYQQMRRIAHPVHTAEGASETAKATAKAIGQSLAVVIATRLLAGLVMGKGPAPDDGDDELERWKNWSLRGLALGYLDPLPLGIGAGAESYLKGHYGSRDLPMVGVIKGLGEAIMAAMDAFDPESDVTALDAAMEAMKAYGFLTGLPTIRPARAAEYLADLFAGDLDEDPGVGDVISGVAYGERKNQPTTPPKMIQSLFE